MASRVVPVSEGASPVAGVNERLQQAREGWWQDTQMFGVIGRVPSLLNSIVPVFESFFGGGRIEAHIFEMMRLKTGQINDCAY
ncbi:MAG: hypothetical protein GKS00_29490 [Alphaproteobacteria bacterium]|nr:hypothetical protein [Alphaproteobacteria bacterium]